MKKKKKKRKCFGKCSKGINGRDQQNNDLAEENSCTNGS